MDLLSHPFHIHWVISVCALTGDGTKTLAHQEDAPAELSSQG